MVQECVEANQRRIVLALAVSGAQISDASELQG
jgi:hypothetical protein